ncbi:MAG TPA: hypothetical protein VGZ47_04260 [Gemmataceae bacterium]|jgi:hypothetical protein|nr:hypothetical protein [Gemmataceae bacterium]
MTLAQTFLPKLGEHRPPGPGRHVLAHADAASGWSVTAIIEKADALSCQLWEITLHRARPAATDPAALGKWAHGIAERVTGLMEPLRVLEIDNVRNEALLRSEAVTERHDKRFHYELKLEGAHRATLRRFQAGTDSRAKREQVPFVLTHETLGKFLDDVTAAL